MIPEHCEGEKHTCWWTGIRSASVFELGFLVTWTFLSHGSIMVPQSNPSSNKFDTPIRSNGTTGRNWWRPEGYPTKLVCLANIFVMRLLYVILGWATNA